MSSFKVIKVISISSIFSLPNSFFSLVFYSAWRIYKIQKHCPITENTTFKPMHAMYRPLEDAGRCWKYEWRWLLWVNNIKASNSHKESQPRKIRVLWCWSLKRKWNYIQKNIASITIMSQHDHCCLDRGSFNKKKSWLLKKLIALQYDYGGEHVSLFQLFARIE